MPLYRRVNSIGPYFQWGNHGKIYYYIPNNKYSRKNAKHKAIMQAMAIMYSERRANKLNKT